MMAKYYKTNKIEEVETLERVTQRLERNKKYIQLEGIKEGTELHNILKKQIEYDEMRKREFESQLNGKVQP